MTPNPRIAPLIRPSAGFTLIELIISIAISLVLLSAAGSAIVNLQGSLVEGTISAANDEAARRLMDRLVTELRDAEASTVSLPPGVDSTSITFSTVMGWDGFNPIVSKPKTLEFNSRRVSLNGELIADDIDKLAFNLQAPLLSIVLEVRKKCDLQGQDRPLARQLATQIPLKTFSNQP